MQFLHPVFTISTLILILFAVLEGYGTTYKNYKGVWGVIFLLIIFSGLRVWVGADYIPYFKMYEYFGTYTDYSQVWEEALFKDSGLDVEWLYVLINKLFFAIALPFFIMTLAMAIITIVPKFYVFEKNSVYPALTFLLYMFPSYFSGDTGHMRQAAAVAMVLWSFEFIKKRNIVFFLITLYIAVSFHKSAAIFLPAYWLATVPLKKKTILIVIIISVILSPFRVYEYISLFSALAPEEIYSGFTNYATMAPNEGGGIKFTDLICAMYTFFIISFDKETCAKIPYYEYMRNLAIVGICLYFIFRESPIFSSRLTAIYFVFNVMVLPNIVASINNLIYRKYLYTVLLLFVVFYYFVFATMQADRVGLTPDRYHNILWN